MNSEKKLFTGIGLRISLAVFSAVGLTATLPTDSPVYAAPVTVVQDAAYDQDSVPAQFDLYALDPKRDRTEYSQRRQARNEFEKNVTDALAGASMSGGQQTEAQNWIARVIMAEMTLNNPTVQMELGEMRQELFRRYISGASEANRKIVIERIIVPKAADVAKKNYHPAARINAVQILNWLDIKEGVSGSQVPQPSMNALGELYKIVNDQASPEYLVATAMAGIQRHSELDGQLPSGSRMRVDTRNMIVDALLAQIKKYENNRTDDDAGYLISRRAIQSLSGLNLPENDPKAADVKAAAEAIANDNNAGRWLRFDAMIALGKMPLADPTAYVKQLGQLVVLTGKQERQALLAAQTRTAIEKQVSEKTNAASAKKKSSSGKSRLDSISSGNSAGASQELGDERGGAGGGGSSMGMMGNYSEGDLMPFHLHYFRTNLKLATSATQQILGTADKARTGLRFLEAVRTDTELRTLIDEIDRQLVRMQEATDIGLVEEKEKTRGEILRMSVEEQNLIDQPSLVRVVGEIGFRIRDLEQLVGKVDFASEEQDEKALESITVKPDEVTKPEATEDDSDASTDDSADGEG